MSQEMGLGKKLLIGIVATILFVSPVAVLSFVNSTLSISSSNSNSASLDFVPLIQFAPLLFPGQSTSGSQACTTPPPVSTDPLFHCYTPSEIATAYGVDKLHSEGVTGAGETIVIVDAYGSPTALQDLQFFSSTFGLPQPDLTIVYPTGHPTFSKSMHGVQGGWAFETSLDLQWAHAMAPGAKLVLIAANPAETEGVQGFPNIFKGEEYAITHYPGSVMSQSFAATEQSFRSAGPAQVAKFDQVYQQAVANHVTVLGSAGDTGTANVIGGQGASMPKLVPYPTVNWPSSDPLVTSAGGTWLQYGWVWNPTVSTAAYYSCLASGNSFTTCATPYLNFNTGTGRTEAVWREDWAPIATGGGLSTLFPTPSFQSGISQSLLNGQRGLPDLSWNAAVDGGVLVYTSFGGSVGWSIVGGTSAASPQLAALVALANQLANQMGKNSIGYLNPILYKLSSSDFNDIVPQTFGTGAGITTLDSNALYGSGIAGYSTTTGWDLTTGFGSPNAFNFVHELANAAP